MTARHASSDYTQTMHDPALRSERYAAGRLLRQTFKRSAHAVWQPAADRPDPVVILQEQGRRRIPELLPIRYERMSASPLAFLRGAAAVMAADLATTPTVGLTVQSCGDCHLLNFGSYATPEGLPYPPALAQPPMRGMPDEAWTTCPVPAARPSPARRGRLVGRRDGLVHPSC